MVGKPFVYRSILILLAVAIPLAVSAQNFKQRYERGLALYERGKYEAAIVHFQSMLRDNSKSSLSDNCQYWIGESYFALHQYERALLAFDRTLAFPRSNKREDALYKIAQCHEKLGEPFEAREMYLRFIAEYPSSRLAAGVMKKIEALGLP